MANSKWVGSVVGVGLGLGIAGSVWAEPIAPAREATPTVAQLFLEVPPTQPLRMGESEVREQLQQMQRDTERKDAAALARPLARFVYSEDESRFLADNETVRVRLFGKFAHEQDLRQNLEAVVQAQFLSYQIDDVWVSPDGQYAIARDRALIDVTLVDGRRVLVASGAVSRWAMAGDRPQMVSSQTHNEVLPVSTLPPQP